MDVSLTGTYNFLLRHPRFVLYNQQIVFIIYSQTQLHFKFYHLQLFIFITYVIS